MSSKIPTLVNTLCSVYDGWIVGSAACISNTNPRDYDVVLTLSNYLLFAHTVNDLLKDSKKIVLPNSFGGWKIHSFIEPDNTLEVDVWADTLENLFSCHACKYAWHPKSGVRWTKL